MICEKILGKLTDGEFSGKKVDYVDIHWDEAFKKLHRKTSQGGTELGIRLDDSVLTRGLNQDDVLAVEGDTVYAVNIPPCEVIVVTVDEHHPHMVAKVCYEIGRRRIMPCCRESADWRMNFRFRHWMQMLYMMYFFS